MPKNVAEQSAAAPITVETSVQGMLDTVDQLTLEDRGGLLRYNGERCKG